MHQQRIQNLPHPGLRLSVLVPLCATVYPFVSWSTDPQEDKRHEAQKTSVLHGL